MAHFRTLWCIITSCCVLTLPAVAHQLSLSNTHEAKRPIKDIVVDPALEKVRRIFAEREQKALAEPYIGVTADGRTIPGLFSIEKTGVSTTQIISSANVFLNVLSASQKSKVLHYMQNKEWRKWSNVDNGIYYRAGVSIKELSQVQRNKLFDLLSSSLSIKGMENIRNVMKTDRTLKELNNDAPYLDEELYFITIMGEPSLTEPWGWQFEGHHLAINYFVLGDQVVMTPVFMGAEPAITTTGKYKGNRVLQQEQDLALSFMQNLNIQQQQQANINEKGRTNMLAAANKDNLQLKFSGLKASNMSTEQKYKLLDIISLYINNMRPTHAKLRMGEIEKHLDDTYFSWAGEVKDDSVFYYRIYSPVVLIEFDHQAPVGLTDPVGDGIAIRDHIHTVIRTPNGNDYGKDLLKQHLLTHHNKM